MIVRSDPAPYRNRARNRRTPFLGTAPPSDSVSCWEIHRDRRSGTFDIYLEGTRIGAERGAAELGELLAGARVRRDDVGRVLSALGRNPVVWLEIRPAAGAAVRRPGAVPAG